MKIAFHTLGCKVNQYETEAMKEQFASAGYEIVNEYDEADVYLINTCSVTGLADRKSRQYIRKMKKKNPDAVVAVTGCYVQVSGDEVAAMDEVDIVAGTNEKNEILNYVNRHLNDCSIGTEKHILDYDQLTDFVECGSITSMESRTRAYVKIQEGCNRFCSYCIIPFARGPVRSRDVQAVITECENLVNAGFKELILTGINTALCEHLEEILDKLETMPGEFRIRLSSLEPTVINAEYVKSLFKYKRLCHHLHLSLQSGSDNVLKAMNRHYNREEYLKIVETLRDFDPHYGITTDIIVGFPGETEDDFTDTIDMVSKAGFGKVHAFKYSKRKGTAAYEMTNQVSPPVKKERSIRLIEEWERESKLFIESSFGDIRRVLFEEYDKENQALTGYTDNYIKAYLKIDETEAESYKNAFADVRIENIFADGAQVTLKDKID